MQQSTDAVETQMCQRLATLMKRRICFFMICVRKQKKTLVIGLDIQLKAKQLDSPLKGGVSSTVSNG